MNAIRLLHVIRTANPSQGGPIEGIRVIAKAMGASNAQLTLASFDNPNPSWDLPGVRMAYLGTGLGAYGYRSDAVARLRDLTADHDLAIVHGVWEYVGIATRQACRGRIPYVVFPHGSLAPWYKRAYPFKHIKKQCYWLVAEQRVLRDSAAVCFTCETERLDARNAFWPYRLKEMVVGYGTEQPPESCDKMRDAFLARCPEAANRPYLLFLSRIHPMKGCDLLIKAFASISRCNPRLLLVMAGPDHSGIGGHLRDIATSVGVSESIAWPGELRGDAKWGAFYGAEAFCLPSHRENFGIAVAEALGCGLPVLISDQVNIYPDIVAAGAGLADKDTVDGTSALLRHWTQMTPERRVSMRSAALMCFKKNYEVGRAAASHLSTFSGIVRSRQDAS